MTSAQARQMVGSLLVAAGIVAVVIVAVTARLGPTSIAEEEARTERQEERLKAAEERREQRQKRLERQRKDRGR
jgi:acyl-CoA hydrolase